MCHYPKPRLHKYYFWSGPDIEIQDDVMEIDEAKVITRYFKKEYRNIAYDRWLENTNLLFFLHIAWGK